MAVPSSGYKPHPRASFSQTGAAGSHPAPNVERPVFPVRLMISRFLDQTSRMRAMCFRLWERSTCGSTNLDAKGKGVNNFGCPPSTDRCGGPELMLIQKEAVSPPSSPCDVRWVRQCNNTFLPTSFPARLTLKQARRLTLACGANVSKRPVRPC